MRTELYRISGTWAGQLAIASRPRGGDWLGDEIQCWRQAGVDVIVSLLTADEVSDLTLEGERQLSELNNIQFISFPISDRGNPVSREAFSNLVIKLDNLLVEGKFIAVHCRQGIGRAALVAICLLLMSGIDVEAAIQRVSAARGCTVPETPDQKRWIEDFAKSKRTQILK
jgi:protein-tyrosine phosphatase